MFIGWCKVTGWNSEFWKWECENLQDILEMWNTKFWISECNGGKFWILEIGIWKKFQDIKFDASVKLMQEKKNQ